MITYQPQEGHPLRGILFCETDGNSCYYSLSIDGEHLLGGSSLKIFDHENGFDQDLLHKRISKIAGLLCSAMLSSVFNKDPIRLEPVDVAQPVIEDHSTGE